MRQAREVRHIRLIIIAAIKVAAKISQARATPTMLECDKNDLWRNNYNLPRRGGRIAWILMKGRPFFALSLFSWSRISNKQRWFYRNAKWPLE